MLAGYEHAGRAYGDAPPTTFYRHVRLACRRQYKIGYATRSVTSTNTQRMRFGGGWRSWRWHAMRALILSFICMTASNAQESEKY